LASTAACSYFIRGGLKGWTTENRRLKKLLAQAILDDAELKDPIGKNG